MSEPVLFDLIERLLADRPLNPAKVSEILGLALARDAAADTGAIEAHVLAPGQPVGLFAAVDLRMPDRDIGNGSVFLSLSLPAGNGIRQPAICQRFGLDFSTSVPSPRYKPGSVPLYLNFKQAWGTLSFGLTADDSAELVRVSLDMPAA
jgi:hypothetical protein